MFKKVINITLVLTFIATQVAYPLPQDIQVVEGSADVSVDGSTMTINASNNTIINYSSFDIAQNEAVIVNLPSASSEILNRVQGPNSSNLSGALTCNGLFILINTHGIFVAPTANIDVQALILSTRDITNDNFMNKEYLFQKISEEELDKLLKVAGNINIREGGFGVLIAGGIENTGTIIAPIGKIALAAGDAIKLDISQGGLISVAILEEQAREVLDAEGNPILDQIKNTGTIESNGGTVILNAESITDVFSKAINLEGTIEAETCQIDANGTVTLGIDKPGSADTPNPVCIIADTTTIDASKFELVGPEDQYLYGDMTISNFECTVPGKFIYFEAGKTYNLLGNTTILGDSESIVKLNSIVKLMSGETGSPWYINVEDDYDISYIGVGDSVNLNEELIYAYPKSDFQGNSGWAHNDSPINIENWEDLYDIRDVLSGEYVLLNDLDSGSDYYADYVTNPTGGWLPIGGWDASPFTGSLDGNGYVISDLYINRTADRFAGLFEHTNGATIQNLGLSNADITLTYNGGTSYAGALVASIYDTDVTNCYSTGAVNLTTNSHARAGGLIGYNKGISGTSDIANCYSTADVTANGGADTVYVGGLIGYNRNNAGTSANVDFSYATGTVVATSSAGLVYAGGLIGYNQAEGGTAYVRSSYATGNVTSNSAAGYYSVAGGLIGYNASASGTSVAIYNIYATGNVTANGATSSIAYAGGLIGKVDGTYPANVENAYATGNAEATEASEVRVGGLIGYMRNSNVTVKNSFAVGAVTAGNGYAGGLVGYNYNGGTITNCGWYGDTATGTPGAGGDATAAIGNPSGSVTNETLTLSDFYDKTFNLYDTTAPVWDFYSMWLENDSAYPTLVFQGMASGSFIGGAPATPYQIDNVNELQFMKNDLDAHYELAGNVDASATSSWNSGAGFDPIGDGTTQFTGTFDGNNYTISGLTISRTDAYVGLFGYTNTATIQDVGLSNVNITRNSAAEDAYVGGLVGLNLAGNITNTYTTGSVSGTGTGVYLVVSGLVGYNYTTSSTNATISNSYSTCTVAANGSSDYSHAGGLVGRNQTYNTSGNATITNSYATGDVTITAGSESRGGGLVALSFAQDASGNAVVSNSYATGDVQVTGSSKTRAGGLVGYTITSGTSSGTCDVTNSYATGNVTAQGGSSSNYAGGLVGWHYKLGTPAVTASNCFATGAAFASGSGTNYAGGLIGNNDGATYTGSKWYNETNTWGIGSASALAPESGFNYFKDTSNAPLSSWDFVDTWNIIDNISYPFLQWRYPSYVTGTAYSDNGTTPLTSKTISLAIGGTLQGTNSTTDASGNYYFLLDSSLTGGTILLTYISGDAANGNTVTISSTTDINDLNIFGNNTLIVRHENAGPITNANLNTAKGALVDDIIYSLDVSDNLTLGSGINLYINAGSTYAPGANIAIKGNWTTAGNFTHGNNSVTFNGTPANQSFTGNSQAFYDLIINTSSRTVTLADTITVDNDLYLTAGSLNGGTLNLKDDLIAGGSWVHGSTNITFDGEGTQTINQASGDLPAITIDKTLGEVVLETDISLDDDFTYIKGNLTLNNHKLTFRGSPKNVTFTPGDIEYYDVTINTGSRSVAISGGALTIIHDLSILDGSMSGMANVANDVIIGSGADSSNSGTIVLNGSVGSDQVIYASGVGASPGFQINSQGSVALAGNLQVRGNWTYVNAASFDAGGYTLTFADPNSSNQTMTPGNVSYGGLTVLKSSRTLYLAGDLMLTGNLSISAGYLNPGAYDITIGGNYSSGASGCAFTAGAGKVTFNGGGTSLFTTGGTGTSHDFTTIEITNGTTLRPQTYAIEADTINVIGGTLDMETNDLALNLSGTLTVSAAQNYYTGTGTQTMNTLTNNGTVKCESDTANLAINTITNGVACEWQYTKADGTVVIKDLPYHDLTFNDGGGTALYELPGSIDVTGSLSNLGGTLAIGANTLNVTENVTNDDEITIGAGIFDVGGSLDVGTLTCNGESAIRVSGDWSGVDNFTADVSTVTIDGDAAQAIGPATFYNLIIANTHVSDEVTISSGTVTVGNTLDVNDGIFTVGSGKTLDVNYNGLNAVDIANGAELKVDGGTFTVDGGNSGHIDVAAGGTLNIVSGSVTSQGALTLDGKLKMADGTLYIGNNTSRPTHALYIGSSGGSDVGDVTGGTIYITGHYSSSKYILRVNNGGKFLPTITTDDTGNLVVMRVTSGSWDNILNYSSGANVNNITYNRFQVGDSGYTGSLAFSGSNNGNLNAYNKFTIYEGARFSQAADPDPIYADKFVCNGTYTKPSVANKFYMIDGDGDPTNGSISGASNPNFGNIDIGNGSAVTVTLGRDVTCDSLDIAENAELATAGYGINLSGNWNNQGAFTHGNGLVTFTGASEKIVSGDTVFNNLTVEQSGGITFQNAVTAGVLTLTDTTGTIAFQGNLTATTLNTANQDYNISITGANNAITDDVNFLNTGTVTLGNAIDDVLLFNGGLATTGNASNPSSTHAFGLIRTSGDQMDIGTLVLDGSTTFDSTNNGASPAGANISFGNTIQGTSDDDFTVNSGTDYHAYIGTVGAGNNINTVSITGNEIHLYGNITTSDAAGNSVTLTGTVKLEGDLTIDTHQTSNDGAITITGTVNSVGMPRVLGLTSGTAASSITGSVGTEAILDTLAIGETSGVTFGGDITTGTLTIDGTSGAVNIGANTLTVTVDLTNNATLQTSGNGSNLVITPDNLGNITFTQDATLLPVKTYTTLTLQNGGTAQDELNVTNLNIQGGNFSSGGFDIDISGDWNNSDTYTHLNNTVTFMGAEDAAITGETTFFDLSCEVGGKNISFGAGETQIIEGVLLLKGEAGNLLVLESARPENMWQINPSDVTHTNFDYLDVTDSENLGETIYATNSVFDNCIGWGDYVPPANNTDITAPGQPEIDRAILILNEDPEIIDYIQTMNFLNLTDKDRKDNIHIDGNPINTEYLKDDFRLNRDWLNLNRGWMELGKDKEDEEKDTLIIGIDYISEGDRDDA